jgi:hypothetical protein
MKDVGTLEQFHEVVDRAVSALAARAPAQTAPVTDWEDVEQRTNVVPWCEACQINHWAGQCAPDLDAEVAPPLSRTAPQAAREIGHLCDCQVYCEQQTGRKCIGLLAKGEPSALSRPHREGEG